MNTIYCGNNSQHPDLLNGSKTLGTRYSCLQKGKNNGFNQPVDPNFLLPYNPIDTTRKYCGNNNILPVGYDRFGGLYECYLSGVGVGKKLKARGIEENPPTPSPVVSSLSQLSQLSEDQSLISLDYDQKYNDESKETDPSYQSLINGIKRTPERNIERTPERNIESNKIYENNNINTVGFVIYILGFCLFFIGMYYGKPGIIMYSDNDNKDKIDWTKFVPYLVTFSVLYGILVYFFIKHLFKKM